MLYTSYGTMSCASSPPILNLMSPSAQSNVRLPVSKPIIIVPLL